MELAVNRDINKPKKVNKIYISSNDERLNYSFGNKSDIIEDPSCMMRIERDQYDYGVIVKKGEEETDESIGTLDCCMPLSYTSIKDPKDGEVWYRDKYPNLPDDFYGVIARYTWGQPQTKKSIKNEKKKYEKKKKKNRPPQGLSVLKGDFEVDFN
tara:strand:- start:1118 stop:1582 length:465 start_codon:yes stop_codon:yes gene_type:complete